MSQKDVSKTAHLAVYYEGCECEDECDAQCRAMWIFQNTGNLAPRPDGRCYCTRMRNDCINYKANGKDCQGFY
jgi:hypothetical protein